tara:strand:- start:278 stop:553 length:276 start_codon:yes stop_codon:yes gene_type:complete
MIKQNSLNIQVDSARISGWQTGSKPDQREQNSTILHGYDLSHKRARTFVIEDTHKFDLILATDKSYKRDIENSRPIGTTIPVKCSLITSPK